MAKYFWPQIWRLFSVPSWSSLFFIHGHCELLENKYFCIIKILFAKKTILHTAECTFTWKKIFWKNIFIFSKALTFFIEWHLYISSSSSCHAIHTDFPNSLLPPTPIIHLFQQVFQATSCVHTELLDISSSCSSYTCASVWRGTSLMCLPLLLQQCPTCLVRLIWWSSRGVVGGHTAAVLLDVTTMICLI